MRKDSYSNMYVNRNDYVDRVLQSAKDAQFGDLFIDIRGTNLSLDFKEIKGADTGLFDSEIKFNKDGKIEIKRALYNNNDVTLTIKDDVFGTYLIDAIKKCTFEDLPLLNLKCFTRTDFKKIKKELIKKAHSESDRLKSRYLRLASGALKQDRGIYVRCTLGDLENWSVKKTQYSDLNGWSIDFIYFLLKEQYKRAWIDRFINKYDLWYEDAEKLKFYVQLPKNVDVACSGLSNYDKKAPLMPIDIAIQKGVNRLTKISTYFDGVGHRIKAHLGDDVIECRILKGGKMDFKELMKYDLRQSEIAALEYDAYLYYFELKKELARADRTYIEDNKRGRDLMIVTLEKRSIDADDQTYVIEYLDYDVIGIGLLKDDSELDSIFNSYELQACLEPVLLKEFFE